MCNEYSRDRSIESFIEEFSRTRGLPPFVWAEGRLPNDLQGQASVRIGDVAPIVRLGEGKLVGSMAPWGWKGPTGKPVFNFVSEGRNFSKSDRVLVPADGFYEFTAPAGSGVKLKDKHRFTLAGEDWFWIAGLGRDGAFTLLTADPGPDMQPYHDRQIVVLPPAAGIDWLTLARPATDILRAPPAGSLKVATVRKDGVPLAM
jgi:putative SOS response-associated peptidase YedK